MRLALGGPLTRLDHFPGLGLLGRIARAGIAKHMGMTPDHLVANGLCDIGKVKYALFLGHLGVEDHLKQQITQFVAQIGHIAALYGIGHLIGLLDRIGGNGGKALLKVPGTAANRCAQAGHDLDQIKDWMGRISQVFGHGLAFWDSGPITQGKGGTNLRMARTIQPITQDHNGCKQTQ